ncbi:MAG: preprotein translocase subunit SecE [Flavobacteriia bacterium]|nr:preprotein translocase subunit SecE [Flavobacteriia bacterium]
MLNTVRTYVIDTYDEMVKNVTWPTWQELRNNTIIVLVSIVLFAIMIFLMDYVFGISGKPGDMWRGLLGFIY